MRRRALIVGLLAVGLGLFAGPVAAGSCAGPLLRVLGATFTPVPPDGSSPNAEPFYTVQAGQPVTVRAENLGPCEDIDSVSYGCGSEDPPEPVSTPVLVENVTLLLEQGSRRWNLGVGEASAPDYTIAFPVDLPADLNKGGATLRLSGATLGEAYVRLQVS